MGEAYLTLGSIMIKQLEEEEEEAVFLVQIVVDFEDTPLPGSN